MTIASLKELRGSFVQELETPQIRDRKNESRLRVHLRQKIEASKHALKPCRIYYGHELIELLSTRWQSGFGDRRWAGNWRSGGSASGRGRRQGSYFRSTKRHGGESGRGNRRDCFSRRRDLGGRYSTGAGERSPKARSGR